MLGHAQHLAARRLHRGGGIPRQRHAECIVGRDIEPGLEAGLGQRRRRPVREHPAVVGPVHHVRRARLAGQVRRHRAGVQVHLVLLGAEIVQRQRDGAVVDLQHRVHVAAVEPFPHDVERDVGVVLVIAHQILDRHALGRRIEILDRLARTGNRHRAGVRAVRPGDVRQMPDLERPRRPRRADHPRRRQARDTPCCCRQYVASRQVLSRGHSISSRWGVVPEHLPAAIPVQTRLVASQTEEGDGYRCAQPILRMYRGAVGVP